MDRKEHDCDSETTIGSQMEVCLDSFSDTQHARQVMKHRINEFIDLSYRLRLVYCMQELMTDSDLLSIAMCLSSFRTKKEYLNFNCKKSDQGQVLTYLAQLFTSELKFETRFAKDHFWIERLGFDEKLRSLKSFAEKHHIECCFGPKEVVTPDVVGHLETHSPLRGLCRHLSELIDRIKMILMLSDSNHEPDLDTLWLHVYHNDHYYHDACMAIQLGLDLLIVPPEIDPSIAENVDEIVHKSPHRYDPPCAQPVHPTLYNTNCHSNSKYDQNSAITPQMVRDFTAPSRFATPRVLAQNAMKSDDNDHETRLFALLLNDYDVQTRLLPMVPLTVQQKEQYAMKIFRNLQTVENQLMLQLSLQA